MDLITQSLNKHLEKKRKEKKIKEKEIIFSLLSI
jgi:hypothetical protein